MELKEGTSVFSADHEEVGNINRVVLNPVTTQLTHIVVQKGLFFPEDRVVPIDWIASADVDRVVLSVNASEIQDLPPFEETHYIRLDEAEINRAHHPASDYPPYYYWYPSFGTPSPVFPPSTMSGVIPQTGQNIPEDTVALKEGTDVISADGDHIGDVEHVLVDPDSNQATHFLISKGLLLKEKKLVPADWISRVTEEKVYLAVGSRLVDQLPAQ
jgi:uncharacterized protein YrrD